MRVTLIVAMSLNRVIGRDGSIPWHVSTDLRRFKQITMDHPLVMGRKTWESIGRPLPGRRNIVLSRTPGFTAHGATVVAGLAAAFDAAGECDEVFVIGGADVYREALARADRILMTRIEAEVDGDTVFPDFDESEWEVFSTEPHAPEAPGDHPFTFVDYRRRR